MSLGLVSRGVLRFTIDVSDFAPFFIVAPTTVRKQISLSTFTDPLLYSPIETALTPRPSAVTMGQPLASLVIIQDPGLSSPKEASVYNKHEVSPINVDKPELVNPSEPEIFNKKED